MMVAVQPLTSRPACAALAPLLIVLSGCQTGLPREQREALSQAARLYQQQQIGPALSKLNPIIRDYGKTPEAAEAYYLRGLCFSQSNQLQSAAQDFRAVVGRGGVRENLADLARASLAMIHYRWGNWDQAAELYAACVDRLPNKPPTDLILFYAGNAMQRSGRWAEARLQFSRILFAFPRQSIARDARIKCYWRYNYFSIQLGTYSESERADEAVRQFRARGLDTWQEARAGVSPPRWVVLTGRYARYADALAALPAVRKFQADAHVVP
ncbi:MAG: tetratricopeptide repeat protein [Phycisphaerae bacterium]|jgi:tetratricopeptide (TPR) repeat protein